MDLPVATKNVLQLICDVTEEENMKVAIKQSCKGGLVTGLLSTAGGILLGPAGLLFGAIFGGLTAYNMTSGSFESVPRVISKMDEDKKRQLCYKVQSALADIDANDVVKLTATIALGSNARQVIIREVINFFNSQMRMPIHC